MAHGRPGISRGATPSTRALALAACAVALGLIAWRAADIFTRAPASPGPLSQTEASLLSVAEAVAGQGHVRISVTRPPGKGRQVLVLLDAKAGVDDAALKRVVAMAAGLNGSEDGQVDLQRIPFAPGISGTPGAGDWAELSLLALLAGLTGWIGATAGGRDTDTPAELVRETLPARIVPSADASAPATPGPDGGAADLARRDPARAADVIRGWIDGHTGDAA